MWLKIMWLKCILIPLLTKSFFHMKWKHIYLVSFQIVNKQALFLWFLNFIWEEKENINTDIVFVGKLSVRLPSARPCIITIERKMIKAGHFANFEIPHTRSNHQTRYLVNVILSSFISSDAELSSFDLQNEIIDNCKWKLLSPGLRIG